MRIIISDTSALIDLRKGALLEALLRLPYEIQVPDLLYEDELLSIPATEKRALVRQGLRVIGLSGALIDRAVALERENPALRLYDCSAWALAETTQDCILLTGDGRLRAAAGTAIEVHGVLWAFDEVHRHRTADPVVLHAALFTWSEDATVWLPDSEIRARQRRLGGRV
ncbi:PIN domain-containing protein [Roseococcus microcysteis]|uniref:hypothetical protein n=1 Tax=Roseococcus microcysteis TaxID=2771361 RepID=UPI00168A74EE|nr:hypothetical protein [Roseococcus microcysteis]